MRKNVLLLNGGKALGILIARALNMSVLYHAVSASSYPEHSRFTFDDYYFGLPFVQDENFIPELNRLIDEKNISFIIPTHDTIALALMEKQSEINATVVCSPLETTRLCRYKSETYKKLNDCDFTPSWNYVSDVKEPTNYPVFIKPDDGQGGKGTVKVSNITEWKVVKATGDEKSIVCEYLPGDEYTVDCFTKSSGDLIYVNPRKRSEVTIGVSSLAESVSDVEEFERIAAGINQRIRFRGYWFIQLKRDADGKLKLMEVCTRFAGTFAHAHASGVNLPLLALSDFSGKDVSIVMNEYSITTGKSFIDRYELDLTYNRVYIDYDDTITCNGGDKVNSFVLAWLYQCKNKGKDIVLITRHTASKDNTLQEDMRLLSIPENLFTEIIDLTLEQNKEDYINLSHSCIFMDNSFVERQKVSEKCGIPVFDVCHVDCLYDWRTL